MDYEMNTDAQLLNELFNEAPIVKDRTSGLDVALSRKLVASWTGKSLQTISDYGTGKYNIPIYFWRTMLEHNFDLRIVELLLGDGICTEAIVKMFSSPGVTTKQEVDFSWTRT